MTLSKDRVMQGMQRFGGAMYTPVILFAFRLLGGARYTLV